MVNVNKLGIVLRKTTHVFENEGVLNPGVIKVGNTIHMFYRAVTKDNHSNIGYCNFSSPLVLQTRNETPMLVPESAYELQGLEDPRIVCIENIYYLSYTAYDGINALGALATSSDLIHWQKQGIIVPQITYQEFQHYTESSSTIRKKYSRFNDYQQSDANLVRSIFLWDKNLVFFLRKIEQNFCFFHRIKPDIQIVVAVEKLEDLTNDFWQNYFLHLDEYIVLSPKYEHEISYVGGGCPPIETADGWLIIYHGVRDTEKGYIYAACAALLDLKNPQLEISRLPYPLFFPQKEWELKGEVNNVCFPTRAIVENEMLYIYYGAADERIALASINLNELLNELKLYKK